MNGRPSSAAGERARGVLVENEDRVRPRRAVLAEVATLRDPLSLHGRQACLEGTGLERPEDVPVRRGDEPHAVPLAVDDEARRDRLHASCREARHDLLPEHRRDLEAVEAVEDPAGLLRVDKALVDVPGLGERALDGVLRDLVEHHAAHGDLRLQHLAEVPGDGLALAILVRCEQELVGLGELLLEIGDDPFLVGVDDVERLEPVLNVDAELAVLRALLLRDVRRALREVADVTDAGLDGVAAAEVAGDGPRLGGGLDDDEAGHVA